MPTRAAWIILVLTAALAWCAPAGAAQVEGTLAVTEVTASTVSFTVTAKRTCVTNEQCDYYADLEEIDGEGPCPATYPADGWNGWNGAVLNAGPSTESATITPRRWLSPDGSGPSQLCLFIYADRAYYLVAGARIQRPGGTVVPEAPGTPTTPTLPGAPKPGGKAPGTTGASGTPTATKPGASTPGRACTAFAFQQSAQKALAADPASAAQLDRNRNGVACEGLPKRKTYVRTLSAAASAAAARAALRRAYGTAFTQRSAYRAACDRRSRTRVRCAVSWRHKGAWTGYVDVVGAIRANRQTVVTHVHVRRP